MSKTERTTSKKYAVSILALLGIFVAAALLALGGRLLPGPIGRTVRAKAGRRHRTQP
jgi:hypothetical protein